MMKLYKISFLMLGGLFAMASCNDIDEQVPEGLTLTEDQSIETNENDPDRLNAAYTGMLQMACKPRNIYPSSTRPDDAGFFTIHFSGDLEGADVTSGDLGFNWFSTACELSSRNANYANPYIRYKTPYTQIGAAGLVIDQIVALHPGVAMEEIKNDGENGASDAAHLAAARAVRAYDYLTLAPYFQFGDKFDAPCIPLLKDSVDMENNPRASVKEVYEYIIDELNFAVENLEGYKRANKTDVSLAVAYGLRARANLFLNNWQAAADDASKAIEEAAKEGISPVQINEFKAAAYCDVNEKNWMWGANLSDDMVKGNSAYSCPAAWIGSFSGDGYSAACQVYAMINNLLYKQIPDSDVRKGWWVDENLYSPLLTEEISWNGVSGSAMAALQIKDVKEPFTPYTNIKFGQRSGIGSTLNNSDWPLMRVEEMYLIKAEGLAHVNEGQGKAALEEFVKTYRDAEYSVANSPRTLLDEIWFQRRVELWGEGFYTPDAKRLKKHIVRFHEGEDSNVDDAFRFNMRSDDGWLNMRFPQTEMDNNHGIVDNEGGAQPEAGQNPDLRDGVTDFAVKASEE